MRSRVVRLAVASAALVGLTVQAPPAEALTLAGFTFVGTMNLTGPLSYPCMGPNVFDTSKCPQGIGNAGSLLTLTTNSLPLELAQGLTVELGAVPYAHGGLRRGWVRNSATCVSTSLNVTKPGKVPAGAGACSTTATGVIEGWCGLATGQGTGSFVDATGNVFHLLPIHFYKVDGEIIEVGHWRKPNGQKGLYRAKLVVFPPTPGTSSQSCTNQTATTFTIVGTVVLAPTP